MASWLAGKWAGVRHLLTKDLQDGFELAGIRFVNPSKTANDRLIDPAAEMTVRPFG